MLRLSIRCCTLSRGALCSDCNRVCMGKVSHRSSPLFSWWLYLPGDISNQLCQASIQVVFFVAHMPWVFMFLQRVPNLIGGSFVDSNSSDSIDVINPVSKHLLVWVANSGSNILYWFHVYLISWSRQHKRLFHKCHWQQKMSSNLLYLLQKRHFHLGETHLLQQGNALCLSSKSLFVKTWSVV